MSASRLWQIADVLDVHVSFFFEDFSDGEKKKKKTTSKSDVFSDKETVELIRSYYAIPERSRNQLLELAKVLAA